MASSVREVVRSVSEGASCVHRSDGGKKWGVQDGMALRAFGKRDSPGGKRPLSRLHAAAVGAAEAASAPRVGNPFDGRRRVMVAAGMRLDGIDAGLEPGGDKSC